MNFLGVLVRYNNLINNTYAHMFFTESSHKAFENFKAKNDKVPTLKDPRLLENNNAEFGV